MLIQGTEKICLVASVGFKVFMKLKMLESNVHKNAAVKKNLAAAVELCRKSVRRAFYNCIFTAVFQHFIQMMLNNRCLGSCLMLRIRKGISAKGIFNGRDKAGLFACCPEQLPDKAYCTGLSFSSGNANYNEALARVIIKAG